MPVAERGWDREALARLLRRFVIPPLRFAVTKVLLALFGVAFVVRITTWVVGPPAYRVYIVGDFSNSPKHVSIRRGFAPERPLNKEIDGCKVETAWLDDKGDDKMAEAIAHDLAERSDTLLVVGHMRSTNTKAALPTYMDQEPPIPVLLTSETNPNMAPGPHLHDLDNPIIRLSATDKVQARDAVAFAVSQGANSFWVIEDDFNPVYAKFLAGEFKQEVQKRNRKVLLYTSGNFSPSFDVLARLDVDCVFFAGVWHDALVAVSEIRKLSAGAGPRLILLTDAAGEQDLITRGGHDVDGVFLMHPMQIGQSGDVTKLYERFGIDARALVERLLDEAAGRFPERRKKAHAVDYAIKKIAAVHRVSDAREILNEVIRGLPKLNLAEQGTEEYTYRAGEEYSDTNGRFHVWKVQNGHFSGVQ